MARGQEPSLFHGRLRGTVARVVFENRRTGWAVVHFAPDDGGLVTVVGPLAPVFPGECVEVEGEWETDRRYGRQFRARVGMPAEPQSENGARRYLASGVIPGIGPELARRLVECFGTETLRVLDDEPERLLSVRGIGAKRLEQIKAAWLEKTAQRQARIFLHGHGLGAALAEKVVRTWGEETIHRVKSDPYALAREVRGIGFRTADGLAMRMGIAADAPARMTAGLAEVLLAAAGRGDCFLLRSELQAAAAKLLELEDPLALAPAVDGLAQQREVVVEPAGDADPRVYAATLHAAERRVARRLAVLGGSALSVSAQERDRVIGAVRQVESRLDVGLADEQRSALEYALLRRLVVVTGGPGTGKTTLVDAIARCADMLDLRVALAAPTGRAAKRMEQATGREAKTIHRLLEFGYGQGFNRGPDNPIEADLVVIDEFSMVDLVLMDAFLAALRPDARLLMVGDADQLPPVGPGAVLRDLIASQRVPTVRLRRIFRQARASLIVRNAHRVNAGEVPEAPASVNEPEADFYMIDERDPDRARELVQRLVTRRIPRRFGLDPMRDVQVLAPMHRGRCGVTRLNAELQAALNPASSLAPSETVTLRVADRVMQLRNDYDREVFNGDIGHVAVADPEGDLTVDFDGRLVGYDRAATGDLTLAYAISVHKSQGSEYPAVVIVLMPEHHIMLQRNLLYTALTRAQRIAVLISSRHTLDRAVGNASPSARNTTLAERIREALAALPPTLPMAPGR